MNTTVERLGRRIRLAVIGGGEGSVIGPAHRTAIAFDGHFEIVAGVLSSDPAKATAQGKRLGIARSYGTVPELIAAEARHPEGIDAVAIMTPNDSHAAYVAAALDAGLHVICDKPLANGADEAAVLCGKAARAGLVLAVTYNYSGYPMVRQARSMIADGAIGQLQLVEVRSVQGNLGTWIEGGGPLPSHVAWRLDPARGGRDHLMLDVGTHAHHLAMYVLDRHFTEVFADLGAIVAGRAFDDTATIAARMEGGLQASLLITKAATGAPNDFGIHVYGSEGGLRWEQSQPNVLLHLRPGSMQTIHRSADFLTPLARHSLRSPLPHPEGFREAFANIYADFASLMSARISGTEPDPLALTLPRGTDGLAGLRFVEACHRSKVEKAWIPIDNGSV